MTDRSALTRIAKSVAAESADRQLCEATQHVLRGLDEDPAHIFDLVDLLAKESNKKRPSDRMIGGYAFLLGHGLEVIRYGVERQDPAMIALVDGLRQHLLDAGNYGKIGAPMLLLILQQFAGAKVEIGDALQALMQDLMLQDVQANTVAKNGEAAEHFAHLAKALGKDAFAIHANLDENTETMPEAARVGMVMALFGDKEPALREAAIGYMLNASNLLRQKLIELLNLAAPQNLISPEMLRRMIAIRNWLPAADRSGLDTAIKAVRKSGVTCATWPRPIVREVFASGVDGSGAFTVLVIAEEAGRPLIAGLLIKQGFGVRDAWVRHKITKAELRDMVSHVAREIDLAPSDMDYVATVSRLALGINVETGHMPPFGLLDFAETVGLANLNPEAMPVDSLVADLCAEIDPARLSATAIAKVLRQSANWPDDHPTLTTWFEDKLAGFSGAQRGSRDKLMAALLAGPLQARRRRWAELVAWTALSLKHQQGANDWQAFATLARELLGPRPLDEIGLMHVIADTTLEVMILQGLRGARSAA